MTRRRGSANVVLPGQTVSAAVTLEARATITGRILDANGQPMPRVSVRLPQSGGFTFVFTNDQRVFTFPDMPLGVVPDSGAGTVRGLADRVHGQQRHRSAIRFHERRRAGRSRDRRPSSSDKNAVLAAYQDAVHVSSLSTNHCFGLPMASVGGFGWTKVQLFQDSTTAVADLKFLAQGQVGGQTEDSNGRPTAPSSAFSVSASAWQGSPSSPSSAAI